MYYALQKLLPVRFKPLSDELFTSWLVRLARGNGTKLHTFSSLLFSERRVWSRDLDKSADDRHLSVMTEKSGFAPELISETFLRSFEGRFYETHTPNGNTSWLMPVGVFHQIRRNRGLQMCPACLREDAENSYYRKYWRVSWVTVCERHGIRLFDRCPGCSAPIVFHRGEMGYRNRYSQFSNVQCSFCDSYWTTSKSINKAIPAHPQMIRFQKELKQAVAEGWTEKVNGTAIHSILFFNGLKHITKLLSVSKRSRNFREIVSVRCKLPFDFASENFHSFDHLPIEMRYNALRAADWLLSDWSSRFVETAITSRTWSSTFLAYSTEIPFWYWLPIHEYLTRQTHYTTETEIFVAFDYLKRHFDLLLPSHLERFIGKPYLFEKRSGFLVASIYDQMKKHNDRKERERLNNIAEQAKLIAVDCSKTAAKKCRRDFKKVNAHPPQSFRHTQSMLNRLIKTRRRNERLKMVKEMEKIQNATAVASHFGVTYPVVLKWYRRFQKDGINGLNDWSRAPLTFRHQIVFEREELWIRELHAERLNLTEIRIELNRRHCFKITEGGLYRVLSRLKLSLPNSR